MHQGSAVIFARDSQYGFTDQLTFSLWANLHDLETVAPTEQKKY
jgi:hypothetical protein